MSCDTFKPVPHHAFLASLTLLRVPISHRKARSMECLSISSPLLENARSIAGILLSSHIFKVVAGLLLSSWLLCEIAFYFYLRYIVLPELNRLTTPVEGAHTPWDEFHKIIDVVSQLKVRTLLSRHPCLTTRGPPSSLYLTTLDITNGPFQNL